MSKYELTPADIKLGIDRVLADAYASSTVSDAPTIVYIAAGPGAGKTAVERYFVSKFKHEKGERAYTLNSDRIAEFHPNYDEAIEELPEECYRITRQFVRPATPVIFDELMKSRINLINENLLDKGDYDINIARKLKENGYRISVNIMATDSFEARLSCYERDAAMLSVGLTPRGCSEETQKRMYNSFIAGVRKLQELGLADEVNVYTRGENINKPPRLKYSSVQDNGEYSDFEEAVYSERQKQRDGLIANKDAYYARIEEAEQTISQYSSNEELAKDSLEALENLRSDFDREVERANSMDESSR